MRGPRWSEKLDTSQAIIRDLFMATDCRPLGVDKKLISDLAFVKRGAEATVQKARHIQNGEQMAG
jgi:hypothetical protein